MPAYNPSAAAERGLLAQLSSVQGAICREVRDVRLATRVLAGGDPRDPWWVPVPFDGPALDPPIRVAVTCESHGYPINPQIAAGIERAADVLSDAGYAVERVATPSIMKPAQAWFDVLASEIVHFLGPAAREHGSETIQTIFEHYQRIGEPVDPVGYRQGIADRTALTREWNVFLDSYPLVLCPFLMRSTYPWDHDAQGLEQVKRPLHFRHLQYRRQLPQPAGGRGAHRLRGRSAGGGAADRAAVPRGPDPRCDGSD